MPTVQKVPDYSGMQSKQPWFVLSAARRFSILESANPSISHFYSFEADSSRPIAITVPDGCVDLFFDCEATNPSACVYGSPLKASSVELLRGHRYIGVRFAPGIVPDFLSISANELIDHQYDLLDLVPCVEALLENLTNQQSFASRVKSIEDFLSNKEIRKSDITEFLSHSICAAKGNVRMKDLESLSGYSSRTLQRVFAQETGMSPKAFCQVIRCQSAIYKIHHESIGFSDLAFQLGFYDQSHFLREFKRYVSTTPLDYRNYVRQKAYVDKIRFLST